MKRIQGLDYKRRPKASGGSPKGTVKAWWPYDIKTFICLWANDYIAPSTVGQVYFEHSPNHDARWTESKFEPLLFILSKVYGRRFTVGVLKNRRNPVYLIYQRHHKMYYTQKGRCGISTEHPFHPDRSPSQSKMVALGVSQYQAWKSAL